MSSSICFFLTCSEPGQVLRYSHLFQNFPQFIVIHTVKGFGIVNKAEIDVFWNSLAFSMSQQMLAIWFLLPLPFLKPAWTSASSLFVYCWSLSWRILSITLLACAAAAAKLLVVSVSVRPHRWQPTRLLCPWDSPGKNTEVGCHCLLRKNMYRQPNEAKGVKWGIKGLNDDSGTFSVLGKRNLKYLKNKDTVRQ